MFRRYRWGRQAKILCGVNGNYHRTVQCGDRILRSSSLSRA